MLLNIKKGGKVIGVDSIGFRKPGKKKSSRFDKIQFWMASVSDAGT